MTHPSVPVIRRNVDAQEARALIARASETTACRVERAVYYPYHWLSLLCSTRTLLGETALRVSCLVDARTKRQATTDPFELETIALRRGEALDVRVGRDEALLLARRYASSVARRRHKALVAPELEVTQRATVYKPFWIVSFERDAGHYRVLVDAVTGGFYPLEGEPPRPAGPASPSRRDR